MRIIHGTAERGIETEGWKQTEMNSWRGSVGSAGVRVLACTVNMFIYVHMQISASVKLTVPSVLRYFLPFLVMERGDWRQEMWDMEGFWFRDTTSNFIRANKRIQYGKFNLKLLII